MVPNSPAAISRCRPWLVPFLLLGACSTGGPSIDGSYYPGCPSFAGNTIRLEAGSYVWEKFTDMVAVGPDGQIVNQFPGFPKRGRYRVEGDTLHLESEDADVLNTFYIREKNGNYVLLTAAELTEAQTSGGYGNCVLTRAAD